MFFLPVDWSRRRGRRTWVSLFSGTYLSLITQPLMLWIPFSRLEVNSLAYWKELWCVPFFLNVIIWTKPSVNCKSILKTCIWRNRVFTINDYHVIKLNSAFQESMRDLKRGACDVIDYLKTAKAQFSQIRYSKWLHLRGSKSCTLATHWITKIHDKGLWLF